MPEAKTAPPWKHWRKEHLNLQYYKFPFSGLKSEAVFPTIFFKERKIEELGKQTQKHEPVNSGLFFKCLNFLDSDSHHDGINVYSEVNSIIFSATSSHVRLQPLLCPIGLLFF